MHDHYHHTKIDRIDQFQKFLSPSCQAHFKQQGYNPQNFLPEKISFQIVIWKIFTLLSIFDQQELLSNHSNLLSLSNLNNFRISIFKSNLIFLFRNKLLRRHRTPCPHPTIGKYQESPYHTLIIFPNVLSDTYQYYTSIRTYSPIHVLWNNTYLILQTLKTHFFNDLRIG